MPNYPDNDNWGEAVSLLKLDKCRDEFWKGKNELNLFPKTHMDMAFSYRDQQLYAATNSDMCVKQMFRGGQGFLAMAPASSILPGEGPTISFGSILSEDFNEFGDIIE